MGLAGLKSKVLVSLLEVLGKNPFPHLFQLLEAACIHLLAAPFLHLQSQECSIFKSLSDSDSSASLLPV